MKAIVTELQHESSVKAQLIAHQLSFDKEIHDRKLKYLRCLLT